MSVVNTAGLDLERALQALLEGEPDRIANLANASSLLAERIEDCNWIGFYLFDGSELVVGPFQGRPACVRIPLGKGVCGTAAQERVTQVVADVHEFPGHIACDAASRSEVVVPLIAADGSLIGVLDVDSPSVDRFDAALVAEIEAAAAVIVEAIS